MRNPRLPTTKQGTLLSPFRYPGGKTWLRPIIRQWLRRPVDVLIEPFAGSGVVSLTALMEGLTRKAIMTERDPNVASVWKVMLNGESEWLCTRIKRFRVTRKNTYAELRKHVKAMREIAWTTLLRNRVSHGGLLASGAGLLKEGEAGNGIKSRWYPETLSKRIKSIHAIKRQISFFEADAFTWLSRDQTTMRKKTGRKASIAYFIDPPYFASGKRLYTFGDVNHGKLFQIASRLRGRVLITYDDSAEIRGLSRKFGFKYRRVPMRSRHHIAKKELLISRDFKWLKRK